MALQVVEHTSAESVELHLELAIFSSSEEAVAVVIPITLTPVQVVALEGVSSTSQPRNWILLDLSVQQAEVVETLKGTEEVQVAAAQAVQFDCMRKQYHMVPMPLLQPADQEEPD